MRFTLSIFLFGALSFAAKTPASGPCRGDRSGNRRRSLRGKAQWRYSDAKIVETDFRRPGLTDNRASARLQHYDYTPHAGGADFDDARGRPIAPDDARSAARQRPALLQLVPHSHHDSGA